MASAAAIAGTFGLEFTVFFLFALGELWRDRRCRGQRRSVQRRFDFQNFQPHGHGLEIIA
ncbi:hypothetical protein DIE19_35635 [Burkholderia sp. Bp9126]|nr:hypothetical protein DIE19_35635 [Burkholderia sp. Bp9126]